MNSILLDKLIPDLKKKLGLDTGSPEIEKVEKTDEEKEGIKTGDTIIHTNFKLPITYLDPSKIHNLSETIASDLELKRPGVKDSMYDYLFKTKTQFGRNMNSLWLQQYTTDTEFLKDTQKIIKKIVRDEKTHKELLLKYGGIKVDENACYKPNYEKIMEVWTDIKEDSFFLEKYGFLEWEMLSYLNESSQFLQCLTIANIVSPIISLFLPVLFIILPFIILKFRGIPINFDVYFEVLKSVAKNHFIGKALVSMESFSIEKVMYLMFIGALYFLQVYQNISICQRFYKNILKINESIVELEYYLRHTINNMLTFSAIIADSPTYQPFLKVLQEHCNTLEELNNEIMHIRPFSWSMIKFSELGYMLKCFYRLYSNPDYENALRYSIGFNGYMENINGICKNMEEGFIGIAEFESGEPEVPPETPSLNEESINDSPDILQDKRRGIGGTMGSPIFENQYYPSLMNENPVKNTCKLDKNIIISSPNRSGKTTILKTTALNIIFTQQFGCGFYSSAKLTPYTHLHSYLNIPDTSERDSLFQAESRRCKEIIDIVSQYSDKKKYRHFCIFDELYSGTNPEEATKAGYAFLKYLSKFDNVEFMLTTHYVKICKKFVNSHRIQNYKMDVKVLDNGDFYYTYKIKKGVSKIKGAIQVMKEMEYPAEIIGTMVAFM